MKNYPLIIVTGFTQSRLFTLFKHFILYFLRGYLHILVYLKWSHFLGLKFWKKKKSHKAIPAFIIFLFLEYLVWGITMYLSGAWFQVCPPRARPRGPPGNPPWGCVSVPLCVPPFPVCTQVLPGHHRHCPWEPPLPWDTAMLVCAWRHAGMSPSRKIIHSSVFNIIFICANTYKTVIAWLLNNNF